ncbi:histidine phosphotransferase family protein [Telmatospirillum sp. J64-1]|uniref:histidine phosphotransferase family protein n=1 Tax=Telmatospirillum sp. J64-1 TaxID=2502183 RepID=UPI00163DC9FF|nr:histidine phosphotransferase family protein [Telmatospirillum sp. J64-1]
MSDADDILNLAELLCARLCHDLSGPLGAVSAGAELLGEGGEGDAESLELLAASARSAALRLKYLRDAFGPGTQPAGCGTLAGKLRGWLGDGSGAGGIVLDWPDLRPDQEVPADLGRLILNLGVLARDCLPRGGRVSLSGDVSGDFEMLVEGPNLRVGEAIAAAGEAKVESARAAQGRLTALLAARLGRKLAAVSEPDRLTLTIRTKDL